MYYRRSGRDTEDLEGGRGNLIKTVLTNKILNITKNFANLRVSTSLLVLAHTYNPSIQSQRQAISVISRPARSMQKDSVSLHRVCTE